MKLQPAEMAIMATWVEDDQHAIHPLTLKASACTVAGLADLDKRGWVHIDLAGDTCALTPKGEAAVSKLREAADSASHLTVLRPPNEDDDFDDDLDDEDEEDDDEEDEEDPLKDGVIHLGVRRVLSAINVEKLAALHEAYGVDERAVLNIAVSELYDAKIANMRDAVD